MSKIYHNIIPCELGERILMLNGGKASTVPDFLSQLWKALQLPEDDEKSLGSIKGNLCNPSKIAVAHLTIVIHNFGKFLCCDESARHAFMHNILPEVLMDWNNNGRKMDVICIDDDDALSKMPASADIHNNVRTAMNKLHGSDLCVSLPVLRYHNEQFVLASWISYCDDDDDVDIMPRPQHWVTMDIQSANITEHYHCADVDFCNIAANAMLSPEFQRDISPLPKDWWNTTWALLDLVRLLYAKEETLYLDVYKTYLLRIIDAMPEDFQELYRQLSVRP